MAYTGKNYLDFTGLSKYNELIKKYVDDADALSFKVAELDNAGNNLLLYKTTDKSDTPTSIAMGSAALRDLIDALADAAGADYDSATGKYVLTGITTTATTDLVAAINEVDAHADTNATAIGTLGSLNTTNKSNLVAAINEVLGAITTAINGLDVAEFALGAKDASTNVITIHGIKEVDGEIAVGDTAANDVTFAAVAATGAASDVSITDSANKFTATDVEGALTELKGDIADEATARDTAIGDAIDALDVTEFALAEKSSGDIVTIHGISETNGEIAVGVNSANDIVLAKVAATGAAADVAYSATIGSTAVTNVDDALDALAVESASGAASKTVYITETSGGSGDAFSKKYGIYQGSTGSASSPVAGEKLADIDIPKDMVVEDGVVVDVVFKASDNTLHEGSESGTDVTTEIKGSTTPTAADAGKYIKLTIANATSNHLWIKATDLVDIYRAQQNASQIQLAIDANNVISATVVAGSITATELASDAVTTAKILDANVTTAKIADDAVTADKIAISAHTESQTAGADGIAVSVTTTDGQVSGVSASIAANTYDAYGAAANAVAALDADLDATATGSTDAYGVSPLATVTGVTEVDGVLTAVDSGDADPFGTATAAYNAIGSIANTDIQGLFSAS